MCVDLKFWVHLHRELEEDKVKEFNLFSFVGGSG